MSESDRTRRSTGETAPVERREAEPPRGESDGDLRTRALMHRLRLERRARSRAEGPCAVEVPVSHGIASPCGRKEGVREAAEPALDASHLSDEERWRQIDAFLQRSETGQHALMLWRQHTVGVRWQRGSGSHYDPGARCMVLDMARPTERVALAFVHEMNHARFDREALGAHGRERNVSNMARDDYVGAMIEEEAEGTCLSIETKIELETGGHTVGAAYPFEHEYRAAYRVVATLRTGASAGLDPDGKRAGRAAVLLGFREGRVRSSSTNEPYAEYYGKAWDRVNRR